MVKGDKELENEGMWTHLSPSFPLGHATALPSPLVCHSNPQLARRLPKQARAAVATVHTAARCPHLAHLKIEAGFVGFTAASRPVLEVFWASKPRLALEKVGHCRVSVELNRMDEVEAKSEEEGEIVELEEGHEDEPIEDKLEDEPVDEPEVEPKEDPEEEPEEEELEEDSDEEESEGDPEEDPEYDSDED
ncbi:protein TsetseEP-like [Eucalyptus grandis]|uniref:protein TsetseEP-like n=1 Tax=Eucalyptus grandis TaxID=71139 RepID=UPI00192EBD2C|nr:protein TsetseEP-like [Eucalyptus grandis]